MNRIETDVDRAVWLRARDCTVLVPEDSGYKSLDGLLDAPMDSGTFLHIAVGIASALAKVHQSGLVHKDVKPANILVHPDSGEVRLTGFGLASQLARERQRPEPPESIAGTLAYMAPEQTGRMNRSIDSRSDLYAFGVTLYQMLTGSLPFTAVDPMELVHCHIAREAEPPHQRVAHLAPILSAIVMKLLAKTPEERYQTAAGVEADLRRCLTERRINEFPLGERDTPDQLMIPEKLYGRSRELGTLLAAFERIVKNGAPELVLVSGYSGVGKSAIVNELHQALVPSRGLFAAGKSDRTNVTSPIRRWRKPFGACYGRCLAKARWSWPFGATLFRKRWDRMPDSSWISFPKWRTSSDSPRPSPSCLRKRRTSGSSAYSGASLTFSPGRNIRWCSSSTICNGSTWRRWT
jgi:serine/threonine protein kinase